MAVWHRPPAAWAASAKNWRMLRDSRASRFARACRSTHRGRKWSRRRRRNESGERFDSTIVVSNADPKRTIMDLVGARHCRDGLHAPCPSSSRAQAMPRSCTWRSMGCRRSPACRKKTLPSGSSSHPTSTTSSAHSILPSTARVRRTGHRDDVPELSRRDAGADRQTCHVGSRAVCPVRTEGRLDDDAREEFEAAVIGRSNATHPTCASRSRRASY